MKNSEILETVKNNITRGLEQFDKMAIDRNIEIWRPISGYTNYAISSKGNVKNVVTGRLLKAGLNKHGYFIVALSNIYVKNKTFSVHRLVAAVFLQNPENKPCIDHIDNCKINNNVNNLRWCTLQENNQNASIRSDNTSGVKGVSFDKRRQKWHSEITINGKRRHIGYYNTLEEAKVARQLKSREVHGEFQNVCEK